MDIAEAPAAITQIDVLIEGRQSGSPSGSEEAHFGIWNYTSGAWEELEAASSTNDHNYNGTISGNVADYLDDATNQLTIALLNEDPDEPLQIDYVQAQVTTPGTPTVVDTISDFQAGAGGDVLNLDDLLPGPVNNGTSLATLDDYLQFSFSGGNTTVHVDHNAGATFQPTMNIVLTGTDITGAGTLSAQTIIQNLLDNGNLQL